MDIKAVVKDLTKPIHAVWDQIAPDAEEMCDGDNECAVEMCIDADRLLLTGNDAAQLVLRTAIAEHGYVSVLSALSAEIFLV